MPSTTAMVPPLTPGTTSAAPMTNPLAMVAAIDLRSALVTSASRLAPLRVGSTMIGLTQLMNRVHQGGDVGRVDVGSNAVAEIEHVTAALTVALEQ